MYLPTCLPLPCAYEGGAVLSRGVAVTLSSLYFTQVAQGLEVRDLQGGRRENCALIFSLFSEDVFVCGLEDDRVVGC